MRDIALQLIRRHEGLRLFPYQCTEGKTTIGYGRNLDDKGISKAEAEHLLQNDLNTVYAQLAELDFWNNLSSVRQAVLADMCFNLGFHGLRNFRKMLDGLRNGDYDKAAEEMLDSRWARQVGNRATRLSIMMRNDVNHA